MSAQDFMDKLVTASCKRTVQCADKYGPAYPDVDSCRRTIEWFTGPSIGFAPDWIRIDQARAEACLEHYSSCDHFTEQQWEDCTMALVGTGQRGDCCAGSTMCAPGLYCDEDEVSGGTCQPESKSGEACDERPCELGLHCDRSAGQCVEGRALGEPCESMLDCGPLLLYLCVDGKCRMPRFLGDPCTPRDMNNDPCFGALMCLADSDPGTGTCRAPGTEVGDECQADFEWGVPPVAPMCAIGFGLICDPESLGCAAVPGKGEDCSGYRMCNITTEDLFCGQVDPDDPTSDMQCMPRAGLGQACDPWTPDSCTGTADCDPDTSRCVEPQQPCAP